MKQHLKYAWTVLYLPVYMFFFTILELRNAEVTLIHIPLDYKIPYCAVFVIPYLLWFLFIPAAVLYFFFRDKSEYIHYFGALAFGMSIFIATCFLFPTGVDFRPDPIPGDGVLAALTAMVYDIDSPTNVFPSMHVYNTTITFLAIHKSRYIKKSSVWYGGSLILSVLIILSTLFMRQHSILDVFASFALAGLAYLVCYTHIFSLKKK